MKRKWKCKLNNWQGLSCILLLMVSVLPRVYIGRYNVLSADDYAICKEMHKVIMQGGGIGDLFAYAWSYANNIYRTWRGYYACNLIEVFNPGVFQESFVWLIPIWMIGSVLVGLYIFCKSLMYVFMEKIVKRKRLFCGLLLVFWLYKRCLHR